MKKEIVFILSSLNDSHFRKRVEEFMDNGYEVIVYGYVRKGQDLSNLKYSPVILGEIDNRSFLKRIPFLNRTIKSIAKDCEGKHCFYSSLDIAFFGRKYIKSQYIYEVCDLTELTISNTLIRNFLIYQNKKSIKRSLLTIITSEAFSEFFKGVSPEKFYLIPNKVSPDCNPLGGIERSLNNRIKIGFVGVIRFETTYHFAKVCSEIHNVELHLYGIFSKGDSYSEEIEKLTNVSDNIIYHGRFSNPDDLPSIYKEIDLVLSAYPPTPGVIYAEPNKLYEALFFRCPIIVNQGTYLGRKVNRLNVGYVIDSMNESNIRGFLESLNPESYNEKIRACRTIPLLDCINKNDGFFKKMETIW
jgi:glycosyltransferase involved in cell wall biosynthesis